MKKQLYLKPYKSLRKIRLILLLLFRIKLKDVLELLRLNKSFKILFLRSLRIMMLGLILSLAKMIRVFLIRLFREKNRIDMFISLFIISLFIISFLLYHIYYFIIYYIIFIISYLLFHFLLYHFYYIIFIISLFIISLLIYHFSTPIYFVIFITFY